MSLRVLNGLMLALAAVAMSATVTQAMSNYKGKYRPLLVFAESDSTPTIIEQKQIVERNRAALKARDVVVVFVVGSTVTAELGPPPNGTATALRARFDIGDNEFQAVLVGKDGGQKLASSKPLGADRLFATIDAMPMRREEMRRR